MIVRDYYLSAHSSTSYTHTCFLFNLCTENSAIAHDKYYILSSNTEVTEFSHNSILNVFQTNRMRISHLLHSPYTCYSNDQFVGWLVRSLFEAKIVFTLVTVTFEWLCRFWKTKISMKAD